VTVRQRDIPASASRTKPLRPIAVDYPLVEQLDESPASAPFAAPPVAGAPPVRQLFGEDYVRKKIALERVLSALVHSGFKKKPAEGALRALEREDIELQEGRCSKPRLPCSRLGE
jgi:hypothetical protein